MSVAESIHLTQKQLRCNDSRKESQGTRVVCPGDGNEEEELLSEGGRIDLMICLVSVEIHLTSPSS